MQGLVLASSSQYRAELLSRLGVTFDTISPDIDESAHPGEPPDVLAMRLAQNKARAAVQLLEYGDQKQLLEHSGQKLQSRHPGPTLVIASDQLASVNAELLGKPLTQQRACEQLARMSGQHVLFHTSLHLLDLQSGTHFSALDITRAKLRSLDSATIRRYVEYEKPLDCAGSFKVESLGISLFESIDSVDPTALIGLPMIELCKGLRQFGWQLP